MPDDLFSLFDDYAARFARGERPEVRAYLARAGGSADELARLIDGYLARAAPPAPSEDTVALSTAALHGRSPLAEARERRGLTRADVVEALVAALGLDRSKTTKVARYYAEIERSDRDPSRVDRRVLEALANTLRASASDLVARAPRAATVSWGLSLAAAAPAIPPPDAAAAAPSARVEPPDEIDRLFGAA
jgi:transcriptional regulator with XRE-family HTH domain